MKDPEDVLPHSQDHTHSLISRSIHISFLLFHLLPGEGCERNGVSRRDPALSAAWGRLGPLGASMLPGHPRGPERGCSAEGGSPFFPWRGLVVGREKPKAASQTCNSTWLIAADAITVPGELGSERRRMV